MDSERAEEERRYAEAAREEARGLDSRVLHDPVRVLRPRPAVTVAPGDSAADAVARMKAKPASCVLVVEDGKVAGIFTERDAVVRILAEGRDASSTRVGDVMTPHPEGLRLDDTIGYALHKMAVGQYRNLPLVDEAGRPVGVLTQAEGVKYLAAFFPEDLINQPPRSFAQRPPRHQHGG